MNCQALTLSPLAALRSRSDAIQIPNCNLAVPHLIAFTRGSRLSADVVVHYDAQERQFVTAFGLDEAE